MAENRLRIIISARAEKAKGVVRDFIRDVSRADKGVKTLHRTMYDTNGTSNALTGTVARLGTALATYLSLRQAIQMAYQYNKTIEDTRIGLATLTYSMHEFSDVQGNAVSGQRAYQVALAGSATLQEKLRIQGLETAATYEQLANAFTQSYVPAIRAGFDEQQVLDFTVAATQAASAMGIPMQQLGEEVRSILSGSMTQINTRLKPLMDQAGLTNAKLRELAETGGLFEAVMAAMSGATLGAAEATGSMSVRLSNLYDAVQQILGIGLQPFFQQLKDGALLATEALFKVQDNVIIWNEAAMRSVYGAGQVMGQMVEKTIELTGVIADSISWVRRFAGEHDILTGAMGQAAETALWLSGGYASLMIISSLTAMTRQYYAATIASTSAMGGMGAAVMLASSAMAGWKIGEWIAEQNVAGKTIGLWVQVAYAMIANYKDQIIAFFEETYLLKPRAFLAQSLQVIGKFVQGASQAFSSVPGVGKVFGWGAEKLNVPNIGAGLDDTGNSEMAAVAARQAEIDKSLATSALKRDNIIAQIEAEAAADGHKTKVEQDGFAAWQAEYKKKFAALQALQDKYKMTAKTQAEVFNSPASASIGFYGPVPGEDTASPIADTREQTALNRALNDVSMAVLPNQEQAIERVSRQYAGLEDQVWQLFDAEKISASKAEGWMDKLGERQAEAIAALKEKSQGGANSMATFWKEAMRNMQNSTKSFFVDVIKGNFDDIGASFSNLINDMAANWAASQLQTALWGNASETGGLGDGLIGTAVTTLGTWLTTSAQGNVFNSPGLSAYSNSIVDRPTLFPFARGMGLMGEAGWEAVMPLTRLPGGDLGVKTSGGKQEEGKPYEIHIHEAAGTATRTEESDGGNRLDIIIERVEQAMTGRMSRGTGMAPYLDGRYGRTY